MSTSTQEIEDQYFYTPSLKGLVQQLTHLAFFGEGMSVVTGASGSGKSSLAQELVVHLDQAHDVVSLVLDADLELAECVEKLADALGLAFSESLSVGEMLAELRHFVQSLSQDKKLVVLLVDEAHHLDDQAVGALVSLLQGGTDSQAGLHLILLSESGLDKRIEALQILDVPVYRFEVPNFSPTELSNFLSRDSKLQSSLNSSLVQKLWAGSQGLPGVALRLVSGGSHDGEAGQSDKMFASGVPFGHIAAIAVLALVLTWSLFLRGGADEEVAPAADKLISAAPAVSEQVDAAVVEDSAFSTEALSEDGTGEAKEEGEAAQMNSSDELSDTPLVDDSIESGDVGTAYYADSTEDADYYGQDALEDSYVDETTVDEGMARDVSSLEVVNLPSIEEERALIQLPPAMVLTESEVFLMAQNPDSYTLQVIAASKKSSLDAYVQRQSNRSSLYMYRGRREGKSWYVVVQGAYSSRDSASRGLYLLPKEQAKAGPWPRKLSSIQEEIETFRRN